MKIDITQDEFQKITRHFNVNGEEMSDHIIDILVIIYDIPKTSEYWGLTIKSFADDREIKISDIYFDCFMDIPKTDGIADKLITWFGNLILMGDGDCPECGSEMEIVEGEYKRIIDFNSDCEPEYVTLWEFKRCNHCGCIENNKSD